jgi:DNA invertase Pin-like site-specific DNA recombinase
MNCLAAAPAGRLMLPRPTFPSQATGWCERKDVEALAKRKDFQKLLADAKNGSFCAVLLSEQSRMSREDVFDAMVHWKLLRDAGVKIVTCQRGELDFSNLGGVITAIVDQYGAREEAVRLADRSLSGKRLAISQGLRAWLSAKSELRIAN